MPQQPQPVNETGFNQGYQQTPQQGYQQAPNQSQPYQKPPAQGTQQPNQGFNQAPAQGQPAPMAEPDFDFDDDIPF